jgi:hypothetical protein
MDPISDKIQLLLLNLSESLDVEIKNWLGGLGSNDEKSKLAKEIIALANNGGGFLFVGFDDALPHNEIEPPVGVYEAFSQDAITSIADKYIDPPIQCEVRYVTPPQSEIVHPIIVVPGQHRTPLFAKSGSPDSKTLVPGIVYTRRPGGKSEPIRTQDDWEKLLDRLVKARQSDQLSAIREILEPNNAILANVDQRNLDDWTLDSYESWNKSFSNQGVLADDPRQLAGGSYAVSFHIAGLAVDDMSDLKEFLETGRRKYSGWPPFVALHGAPNRPYINGNCIEAHILDAYNGPAHADFWRLSNDGRGFLIRGMQEDEDGYGSNMYPGPPKPAFDWVLPIYRMTEVLFFIRDLSSNFGGTETDFELLVDYRNMAGRSLCQQSFKYTLFDGGISRSDIIKSYIQGRVSNIDASINELLYALLAPVYTHFDFTKLPKALVNNVVNDVRAYNY